MTPEKILEQHDLMSGYAQKHLRAILFSLCDALARDGWTKASEIERDPDELFGSPSPCTTFCVQLKAACHDDELTLFAGFSTGYEPSVSMYWHDFGLKLVNGDDVTLFETPLQTWQGQWTSSQIEDMLFEATREDAALRVHEDLAACLTM